jgi:hypothetical protein
MTGLYQNKNTVVVMGAFISISYVVYWDKINWVIIGRQCMIYSIRIGFRKNKLAQNLFQDKINWVIIGRQYMFYWVRIGFRGGGELVGNDFRIK